MRWPYFLSLLFGVRDNGLRVGLLAYQRSFRRFNILLPGCGMSKNIKLKDDISVIWPDNWRKLSLRWRFYFNWVWKDTTFDLTLLEFDIFKLCFRVGLTLSSYFGMSCLRFCGNINRHLFLFDGLEA